VQERRRFVRLTTNVRVKWKKIIDTYEDIAEHINDTKNISGGGICLMVDERLGVGDRLYLEIELPTKKIIYSKGRVVWIKEYEIIGQPHKKSYDTGIEFLEIGDKDREDIKKFIFTILHSPQAP